MKKSVALLTSALLATTVVVGAASCASKDVSKLLKEVEYSENTKTLSALTKDDVLNAVDNQGLMVVSKVNKDAEENEVSTTYKLFDVIANAYVSGAEVTVALELPENIDSLLTYSVNSQIIRQANGFYYSTKKTYTRESTEVAFDLLNPDKIEYTLYGKNGKVAENVEGAFEGSYVFTAKDGARYYLDVNANVSTESDPLARIVTLSDGNYMMEIGDYLVDETDGIYTVYDQNGKYVRTVNGVYEMEIPATITDEPAIWSVGNYMFMQYSLELPESEKKYDYIDNGADGALKYDLVTKRYDLEKGKVKDIDMEYLVVDTESAMSMNDETTILSVSEIKDEQIMSAELVQSFDKNGNVAVDLQKLVPGAYSVQAASDEYIVLESGDMDYVVKGKEVIGEFVDESVNIIGYAAVLTNQEAGTIRIYNLDGTLNKTYTDVQDADDMMTRLIIQLESSIVIYDLLTNTETVVCSYDKDNSDMFVDESNLYVGVVDYGADKEEDTEDDKYSIYFLVPGVNNFTNLTEEEMMKIYVQSVVSYNSYSRNSMTMGTIFSIAQTTGEGESATTNVTYYSYEVSANM